MTLSQRKPLSIHWLFGTIPGVEEFKKVKITASILLSFGLWNFERSEQKIR